VSAELSLTVLRHLLRPVPNIGSLWYLYNRHFTPLITCTQTVFTYLLGSWYIPGPVAVSGDIAKDKMAITRVRKRQEGNKYTV
jgi:hypothetical protein